MNTNQETHDMREQGCGEPVIPYEPAESAESAG